MAFGKQLNQILNNARSEFSRGGVVGDLVRGGLNAASQDPFVQRLSPNTAQPYGKKQYTLNQGTDDYRDVGGANQQLLGSLLGDPLNLVPAAPAIKAGGKALGNQALNQYVNRTGIVSQLTPDPRQYMLVGEKGINNLGLQDVLAKAKEMKAKNARDEEIWKATSPMVAQQGVRGGGITYQFGGVPQLEISDDLAKVNPVEKGGFAYTTLQQVLEHPTLYKADPSLKSVAVTPEDIDKSYYNPKTGLLGVGNPHRTTTGYTDELGNLVEQYNFKPDVIGHEVNHAIQFDQDLPQGGNQSTKKLLNKFFEEEKQNYAPSLARIAREDQNLSNLYKTSAIQYFNRILNKPSYKPRDLQGRSDFYQYSDDIRSQLGAMPKKAGESRNEYIRNANQILFDKYKEKKGITQQDVDRALGKTAAQTKYQINKIYKKLEPDYVSQREFAKLRDKNYEINQLNPFEVYDRLTGEAASRVVQDRWNMTPEERGLLYPVPTLMDTKTKINPYELIDLYYD
jgi:hypothetical protein